MLEVGSWRLGLVAIRFMANAVEGYKWVLKGGL
jgi:hypothetical protein